MKLNNAHEGYDYQDLLTSYFILREILEGNINSIFTIDKKNTPTDIPDRFDDLVIINGDKVQRKQIKYSNQTISKTLEKKDLANDQGYGLALYKLFETWQALNTLETEFRLCLAWNEPVDEAILRVLNLQNSCTYSFPDYSTKIFKINIDELWQLNPEKFNRWNSFKDYVKDHSVDRSIFAQFCDELLIEVNFPKTSLDFNQPHDLENILIKQAEKLGIGQYPNNDVYIPDFLVRLAKLVCGYRAKTSEISATEILSTLRVRTDFGKIEQKFELDQTKNIVYESNNKIFLAEIKNNNKTLLIAEPGAGKSWFLTNFIEYLETNNHKVIRHYCFTSTEDEFYEQRATSDVFFGNLISDIVELFPQAIENKNNKYTANIDELNLLLSQVDEPLVIIIDGLDHIDRVLKKSNLLSKEKTRIIDYISEIQSYPNISIVLGSQPVSEVQRLIGQHNFVQKDLPKWSRQDTKELMKKFQVADIEINHEFLSSGLQKKSQGNPLYLTYILKTLNTTDSNIQDLLEKLPAYDFNLQSYYQYLSGQLDRNTTSETLACLDFAVTRAEIKEIIPKSHYFEDEIKILTPVISENSSRGGISLYHDSFRRFQLDKLDEVNALIPNYKDIANWLKQQGFYENAKSYRYLLNYLIKSENYQAALPYATNDFLADSLYYGHSESAIKTNVMNFALIAEKSQDWALFIYLNELSRTIDTTNSEEYHSQFEENFELYFEAVCLIYGTDRANELLFFNREKNFNDRVTAQAFCILQKYGYQPLWKKVNSLFDESVYLDDVRYYIFSLINGQQDSLEKFFVSVTNDNDGEFLQAVVSALIDIKQIDFILNLYKKIKNDNDQKIAKQINNILAINACTQRIDFLDFNIQQITKKEPLSIDFVKNGQVDYEKLKSFYDDVKYYAKKDINVLISFEKSILSHNFFYNWIKFFIKFFIIESTVSQDDLENEIVKNIEFLASDTKPFKGEPRAIDFTYRGSVLIDQSIVNSLKHISSKKAWKSVIKNLTTIPYDGTLAIIERHFLNQDNIQFVIDEYSRFEQSEESMYYDYAKYAFKKSIYYAKSNNFTQAKVSLKTAIKNITTYTFRKDTTLSEIIEPLESINKLDSKFAEDYAKRLKFLSDAVEKHTEDGKGIRWLAIDWFKQLLNINYSIAGNYLINQLMVTPYYWKLDYMFVDFLKASDKVNPLILNFLYKLSPTNNRDEYLSGFLSVIDSIKNIDRNLAKLSLINLSSRDWNDIYNKLKELTLLKFNKLNDEFGLSIERQYEEKKTTPHHIDRKSVLSESENKYFQINNSIKADSLNELMKLYSQKHSFSINDLNDIYSCLINITNEQEIEKILLLVIRKRFTSDDLRYFEKMSNLILKLNINDNLKIKLLVNNFVYSKNGWFECFVHKESLEKASYIDKDYTLQALSRCFLKLYSTNNYLPQSTSNLIIAFEYVGIDRDIILPMYARGFDFIANRLPDENNFKWDDVEDDLLSDMNENEFAVALMLSKTRHHDAYIQREVLVAISYLIEHDQSVLIKPLKWMLTNYNQFNSVTFASVLELLLIELNNKDVLLGIRQELEYTLSIDNLYIHNTVRDILESVNHG
ncbi:hypothetical protein QJU96_07260 [Pasteurella skyensis]|uniref:Nephrocystin 3-like N-terminal domain-containing protein n=1 Tax=Phocoenobacter skyensis TaxID=97481 RepID=A0AAJ6NBS9_9PAST|nr:hypothetical protein [Pasteurella skyensis]MDP8171084.1 hypothetical protein [Pasteurella skyensis]MDP8173885.1 hypothetical protein [Pasteurella skyensis]